MSISAEYFFKTANELNLEMEEDFHKDVWEYHWFYSCIRNEDITKIHSVLNVWKENPPPKNILEDFKKSNRRALYELCFHVSTLYKAYNFTPLWSLLDHKRMIKNITTFNNDNFEKLFRLLVFYKSDVNCLKAFKIRGPRSEWEFSFLYKAVDILRYVKAARRIEKAYLDALNDEFYLTPLHLSIERRRITNLLEGNI